MKHRETVHHTDQATAEAVLPAHQATAGIRHQAEATAAEVHHRMAQAATAGAHRAEVTEDKEIT